MHEEEKHAPTAVSVEHTLAEGNNNSCDGEQSNCDNSEAQESGTWLPQAVQGGNFHLPMNIRQLTQ